jgi:hypothetical protein
MPLVMVALVLVDLWQTRRLQRFELGASTYTVVGTSAWGLVKLLPSNLCLLLVLMLPFISADGVARDVKRGTNDLLMTTPLPNWAYLWGRYLPTLLLGLGLALALLVDLLVMGVGLPLIDSPYPAPQVGTIVTLWAMIVLPTTTLLTSASFVLGVWMPRHTNFVKLALLIVWLGWEGIFNVLPKQRPLTDWQLALDPTSNGRSVVEDGKYFQYFLQLVSSPRLGGLTGRTFDALQQHLPPDWGAWMSSQCLWTTLGCALVAMTPAFFKRFRRI